MIMSNFNESIQISSVSKSKLQNVLKLADGIKTRKKSSSASITSKKSSSSLRGSKTKYDPAYTNIEHLVFGTYKVRPSTPNHFNHNHRNDNTNTAVNGRDTNHILSPDVSVASDSSVDDTSLTNKSLCSPLTSPVKCECKAHSLSPNDEPNDSDGSKKVVSNDADLHKQCDYVIDINPYVNEKCLDNDNKLSDMSESNNTLICDDVMERTLTPEEFADELDLTLKCEDLVKRNLSAFALNNTKRQNFTSKIPQRIVKSGNAMTNQKRTLSTHAINSSSSVLRDSPLKIRSELLNRSLSYNGIDSKYASKMIDKKWSLHESRGIAVNDNRYAYSQIPKSSYANDVNSNAGSTPPKSDTNRINYSRIIRKQSSPSQFPITQSRFNDLSIPLEPNLHIQRQLRPLRNSVMSSPFDAKFAKIRSTLHANKRMPHLQTALRRHHSFDATQRHFGSPHLKNFKMRSYHNTGINKCEEKNTKTINFAKYERTSYMRTSIVSAHNSNFSSASSSSSDTRHFSSYENYDNSEMHSAVPFSNMPFNDLFNNRGFIRSKSYEKSKRESFGLKSQGNLQRNRPLLKGSPQRAKSSINTRTVSSNTDDTIDGTTDSIMKSSSYEQIISSQLSNLSIGPMFIMDEDNLMVSPKKLMKTPVLKGSNRSESSQSNGTDPNLSNNSSPLHIPMSTLSSPEKRNINSPLEIDTATVTRPRSSSDYLLSNLLLSEAQKEALNDVNEQTDRNAFSKSSRPWSHIYSESEVKRILGKNFSGVIGSLSNLVTSHGSSPIVERACDSDVESKITKSKVPLLPLSPLSSPSADTVLQKFKKTFSLHFTRSGNSQRTDSPVQAKLRSSLRSKSEDKCNIKGNKLNNEDSEAECQLIESAKMELTKMENVNTSLENEKNDKNRRLSDYKRNDINQQLNCVTSDDRQFSTPPPIKSRDNSHPRPVRNRSITRTRRLRRSLSQPHDIEKWTSSIPHVSSRDNCSHKSSESETESDSVNSNSNAPFIQQLLEQTQFDDDDDVIFAEALWDHVTLDNEELSFRAGEMIEVTDSSDKDWWWGTVTGGVEQRCGWFPASFVRMRVNQDDTVEESLSRIADGTLSRTPKRRLSVSLLSNEQVRANVVLEIINTERDFVKHLNDVIEGYLIKCKSRSDMFSDERLKTIFGNIEQLYEFQREFLNQLESCINWGHLSSSKIGDCFLLNEIRFTVYCEYCNNHPLAVSELQDLYAEAKYAHFFEGCRLIQNMIDISLDGFLLTPIQKICKYPLQLAELLKYTRTDHDDYTPVKNAREAMQRVALLVNEKKRRIESLEQIVSIQKSIEGMDGPQLIDLCSILLHSGDVIRLSSSSWSRELTLFLFDHYLICCKRETGLLKRNTLVFKGKIEMDSVTSIVDVEDGIRDPHFNLIAKNAFKLYSESRDKWYMFQTKTAKEKVQWLRAFEDERQRIADDQKQGFIVTENDKRCAQMAHVNHLKPKRPRAKLPKVKPRHPDTAIAEIALEPTNGFEYDRSRAGSLPLSFNPAFSTNAKPTVLASGRQPVVKTKGSGWFKLGSKGKGKGKIKQTKRIAK